MLDGTSFLGALRGQKLLVTGASGFIGSRLCTRLTALGAEAEVHAISRAIRAGARGDVTRWWQADLTDSQAARELFLTIKPDIIFHLAGDPRAARHVDLVWSTFRGNFLTTLNLLTSASEFGCRRLIIAGSLEEPHGMENEVCPSSPYAASKWASTSYARMFHRLYQVPVVIARLFMTYGPGQDDRTKLIPYSTLCFLNGETPKVSSGWRKVDWIFVDDVVEGLLAAASAGRIEGSDVDLGSGSLVSIGEIVQHLARIVGTTIQPAFGEMPDRPMEQVRAANAADSLHRLGWRASTSLEDGLFQTVAWYRNLS